MKSWIRALPASTLNTAFGIVYAITLLAALFPPLYLAASGRAGTVLGLPFSLAYWILDALVIGLALWLKYHLEDIRGELDEELPTAVSTGSPR
ncbi:putative outer membrane lipoprotein [Kineococcus radiotolerans]|uniref:Putative outer membrane lipoprotein n=1 Tax=Kineococcus radiotolerans TaxID=131568 RepID=A0A7W4TQN9_KINRA|nr:hypothetical protein [Kineococcus radiotolerans]MBB2903351.1 putative outer membrane lipoprotein [Kineococcus radiotolerans]